MVAVLRDMEELQRSYSPASGESMAFGEIFVDAEEISVRHAALTDAAHFEILAFGTARWSRSAAVTVVAPTNLERRQVIDARSVYTSECLSAWGEAFFDELMASGEQIRLTRSLPTKMKIVDRRQALIGLEGIAMQCALFAQAPAFVEVLRSAFEATWEQAVPYQGDADEVTTREREVLVLLATGDKDEAIAKKLGVGVRTVRRHISSAMQKLGTESRFAAGVQAVKRGWL